MCQVEKKYKNEWDNNTFFNKSFSKQITYENVDSSGKSQMFSFPAQEMLFVNSPGIVSNWYFYQMKIDNVEFFF